MSEHAIEIDNWHPTLVNKLINSHWAVANRLKQQDKAIVKIAAVNARTPAATGKRRVRLIITLGPGQRAGDPDAYWKSLLDALKFCGMIVDDNRQNVETPPVEFQRNKRKATTIILEDLA